MRPSADLNLKDKEGIAPVHIACVNGDLELFNYLKTQGADVNVRDSNQKNILHYACINPNLKIIQDLVASGISVNSQDAQGFTPLHFASVRGDYQLTELLLRNGAKVDIRDAEGNTPLAVASFLWDWPELIDMYIAGGANPSDGLLGAYTRNNPVMVNHLLEKGADHSVFASAGINIQQNPIFQNMPALRSVA